MLETLSPEALSYFSLKVIPTIVIKRENAIKFTNSEQQTDSFINRYPKFSPFIDLALSHIKEFRKDNGLEV